MKELVIVLDNEQLNVVNELQNNELEVIEINKLENDNSIDLIDKSPCVYNSYKAYEWLMEQKELPRTIYFQDKGAIGFFSIQAQKVLGLFKDTEFKILEIGKTSDEYKIHNEWSNGKAYDLKLSYMEEYTRKYHKSFGGQIEKPLVSVCISHFNHGKYLPDTLKALEKNTYENFEVIIIDSESTDEYSLDIFKQMEQKYKDKFRFYHRSNESLGETRNHAVEMANGEYIIFFDSDNLPESNMIEEYVKGMQISKCDCLTSHNLQFEEGMEEILFTPIGPALAYGMLENCFGDSAFCIKKHVFKEIGGFTKERLGLEDWEFLAKLSLKGYKQDVLPKPIYRYRRNDNSMANTVNNFKSHNRALRPYMENQPEYIKQLLVEFCIPVYKNGYKQYENIDETTNPVQDMYMGGIGLKFIKKIDKILPKGSKRRNFIKKCIKKITKR